jgi:ergothioneine biosynthesis protein EgtB
MTTPGTGPEALVAAYTSTRAATEALCATLETEDYVIQAMPDVSPAKWHLAHVSWFFETFLLRPHLPGYRPVDERYAVLFNSYYNAVGPQFSRPERGTLSRPTVAEVYAYRAHVDEGMLRLLETAGPEQAVQMTPLIDLGVHHEQQHQELLLTDLKYNLSVNPLRPALHQRAIPTAPAAPLAWRAYGGGIVEVGHGGEGFAFDNESPRHRALLEPFAIASRPVTNAEYLAFMDDGGYATPTLWLSQGWAGVQREGWEAPLHWERVDGQWHHFTLSGLLPVDMDAPVSHVSYVEAEAFAHWAGARLPSEQEWEHALGGLPVAGNLAESGLHQPVSSGLAPESDGMRQAYGDVWEWTRSAYLPYPGYRQAEGAVGEYNGKFMLGQMVLRGGSCATPASHIRGTYRNFFYPPDRWQFTGLRLAKDG